MAEKDNGISVKDFTKMEMNTMIEALDVLAAQKKRANDKEANEKIKEFRAGDIALILTLRNRIASKELV